jgi:hypothetical protein
VVSISEEIRASAGAHRDLGPAYDTAIAEGLIERIGEEIDRRVDARLYRQAGAAMPPSPGRPARPARSGPGSMAMAIGATAVVVHPGFGDHVGGAGALVALIWIAIGAINYSWSRRRLSGFGEHRAQDAHVAALPQRADLGKAGRAQRVDVHRELAGLAAVVPSLDPPPVPLGCFPGQVTGYRVPPALPALAVAVGEPSLVLALAHGPVQAGQCG